MRYSNDSGGRMTPARAGTTPTPSNAPGQPTDDPRSRGDDLDDLHEHGIEVG